MAKSVSWRNFEDGISGLPRTAICFAPGTAEVRNSRPLTLRSVIRMDSPVMFPPGLARLATWPVFSGSACIVKTMGIEEVAALAPCVYIDPRVTIRSTLSRTRSAASSWSRAELPSAQRDSIRMFLPSIQPRSRRPDRKACHRRVSDGSEAASPKIPTRYTLPAGCASPTSGARRLRARTNMSPINRMGTSVRMAGGSLAERPEAHQRTQQEGRRPDSIGQRSKLLTVLREFSLDFSAKSLDQF